MTPDQTLTAYTAAALHHDLEAMLAFVAEDAVYLFSNETCHIGKAAVREAIARNFAAIRNETYGLRKVRWLARTEDLAVAVYEYHWSGEIGGETASGGGRGTTVLRRRGERWEIVHEHLSRGTLGG
jgi:ketosteroid isomerase-like protein